MRALDRKLVRDLWRLRGQVIAIALVVASGVAMLVMSLSTVEALTGTADAYYERYRFADLFASVKRAPERLAARIARLPGVQTVETRIVELVILDVPGFREPVMGRLVSVPEFGAPVLNRLVIRSGRSVRPGRPDEVVVSEPFADAHGLGLGDRLDAIVNGKKRALRIVGTALSPEYVYAIGPGALMPDDHRYGILWMGRKALAAAFDLDGAFNDVSMTLFRGARTRDAIDRLDRLLDRYGGVGAYARADQISNWFLMNEIRQVRSVATILPSIFLAVAAFLANMVLARVVATERSEIGLMKAFGYRDGEVGWHYAKIVIAIALIGITLGSVLGAGFGQITTEAYADFFRFPFLLYRPSPWAFAIAGTVSLAAALVGALAAVARAVRLPPAQALLPPPPPVYRRGRGRPTGLARHLDQPTRMVLRQVLRWPVRSSMTAVGIAFTVGVLISSLQWLDSIDRMIETFFRGAQHQDLTVGLAETRSSTVMHAFARMPGVLSAEPARFVSARLIAGHRSHRGAIEGVRPGARLSRVYDVSGRVVHVPRGGLVLGTKLAEKLAVGRGDWVTVKILEGRRPTLRLRVVELFETYIGTPAYIDLDTLGRLMRERPSVEHVQLLVDPAETGRLFAYLKGLPSVAAVMVRRAAIATFNETMGETLMIYISFFIGFACMLAFGVVYNSARISLSERGRDLATLRVLGFSQAEISYILLGEVALLILVGLPVGCLLGYGLVGIMTSAFDTELYRVPFVIESSTYGVSVLIALAATAISAAYVRRRVDRLDLIAVLKTRE